MLISGFFQLEKIVKLCFEMEDIFMIWIFVLPVIGLIIAILLDKIFPRAQFSGRDVLPFFLIAACSLITFNKKLPSFLPYGFLLYFILAIGVSLKAAIINKNISLGKTIRQLWDYLDLCTIFWYLGLLICMAVY